MTFTNRHVGRRAGGCKIVKLSPVGPRSVFLGRSDETIFSFVSCQNSGIHHIGSEAKSERYLKIWKTRYWYQVF